MGKQMEVTKTNDIPSTYATVSFAGTVKDLRKFWEKFLKKYAGSSAAEHTFGFKDSFSENLEQIQQIKEGVESLLEEEEFEDKDNLLAGLTRIEDAFIEEDTEKETYQDFVDFAEKMTAGIKNHLAKHGRMKCGGCGFVLPVYVGRNPKFCPDCAGPWEVASHEKMTHGINNKLGKMGKKKCGGCGFALPKYPGRDPKHCPDCGGDWLKKAFMSPEMFDEFKDDITIIREEISKRTSLSKAIRVLGTNESSLKDVKAINSAMTRVFIQAEKSPELLKALGPVYLETISRAVRGCMFFEDVEEMRRLFLGEAFSWKYHGLVDGNRAVGVTSLGYYIELMPTSLADSVLGDIRAVDAKIGELMNSEDQEVAVKEIEKMISDGILRISKRVPVKESEEKFNL